MPIGAMAPPEAMLFSQLHSTHLIETARLQQHSFFFCHINRHVAHEKSSVLGLNGCSQSLVSTFYFLIAVYISIMVIRNIL